MELFADSACTVAEGPRFNSAQNALYWVDVTEGDVFRKRLDATGDGFERFSPGLGKIGACEFAPDGRLLLFAAECNVYLSEFGGVPEPVACLEGHGSKRFNDVTDAGGGVFFCGVAPSPENRIGELWRYDSRSGRFDVIESSTAGMPNGMGFSPDRKTFYFVVSDEKKLYAYDFDDVAKIVSNRRVLCGDFDGPGVPDGMCVDPSTGDVLVAVWDGYRLERRSAEGKKLDEIRFPMAKVTSACLVGDRIYVTTANFPRSDAEHAATKAGGVFVMRKNP